MYKRQIEAQSDDVTTADTNNDKANLQIHQEVNSHLKFAGIEIDGSLATFRSKLIEKGYKPTDSHENILQGNFAGYECDIFTVSDTHLDVYKRQGRKVADGFAVHREIDGAGARHDLHARLFELVEPFGACLLYTSIVPITSVVVFCVGIFGSIFGEWILRRCGVRDAEARGFALGAAAHGIGTARAIEIGAVEGALSGLAMALMGLATALLMPLMERYLY